MKRLATWLVLGIAVSVAYAARRGQKLRAGRRRRVARGTPPPPIRPFEASIDQAVAQAFGDTVAPEHLDVEALSGTIDQDLERLFVDDGAAAEWDADEATADLKRFADAAAGADAYGEPLPDDDRAQEEGANWLEALEARTAEDGGDLEVEIEIVDDPDEPAPIRTRARRDTPVADHGSAGPRGL